MTWTHGKFLILLLVIAVALAACGGQSPEPTEQVVAVEPTAVAEQEPTSTPVPPEPTATETPAPTETTAPNPTTEPTPTEEVVAEVSDECLACHSDQEQLTNTAAPEEKAPSESSGVG